MSAVLTRDSFDIQPEPMPQPRSEPTAERPARSAPKRKVRRTNWALLAALYAFAGCVAYAGSSIAGYAMTEQARRDALRAAERARAARGDVAILRERVDRLSSVNSLESWAALRGFALPDAIAAPPKEGVRVASLR